MTPSQTFFIVGQLWLAASVLATREWAMMVALVMAVLWMLADLVANAVKKKADDAAP